MLCELENVEILEISGRVWGEKNHYGGNYYYFLDVLFFAILINNYQGISSGNDYHS